MPPRDLPPGREGGKAGVEYAFVVEVLKDTTPDLDFWLDLASTSTDPVSHNPPPTHSNNPRPQQSSGTNSKIQKRPRKHSRTQRWAPFTISPDGSALQNASLAGPGTVGKMSEPGQMHIGKQFPFGRRV